ncbi:Transketolase [Caenispirillum salinarum AK4]|uniref:Transketolase n=1 Tax=Caenispirillum salinarum AK4 TaxID=1238182 RepID=K9GWV4_9PROT|nr:transketolase [Caenispirillum salinarum]EKV29229.1 Transketolase [Caenispirillum salinarum AK4]
MTDTATKSPVDIRKMANAIRFLSMDAVQKANSGHPGMPMGMADVAAVLFTRFAKVDPTAPRWPDRDRFVLSAGHGSMLLYSLAYLLGYKDVDIEQIQNFRQLGARTAGHPEYGHVDFAETTTGPLGQGIANAVGMALGERMMNARFGSDLVDHYTWVIAGDGCLMEGISQEVVSFAGHQKLGKLVVFWDDNQITIDGETSKATSEDQLKRFEAAHWHTQAVDGHDPDAVAAAIEKAKSDPRPSLIACRTVIGYGAPSLAGTAKTHGAPLGEAEINATREALDWPHAPFEVPDDVLNAWRAAAERGTAARRAWEQTVDAEPADKREAFFDFVAGKLPKGWERGLDDYKKKCAEDQVKVATRKASQQCLEHIVPALPQIVGGSADLTGSNLTNTKQMSGVEAGHYAGNYVYWGVREHGMAAMMNGLALHGGFIPYGGTFLVFTDYLRPALRMSAIMNQRVVYVMTHDSIGLGEDGPTHQPVEHLASLRAMPNVLVMRPADAIETAECWQIALHTDDQPSVLALSRQNLPTIRQYTAENLCARGGYVLSEPEDGTRDCTIIATGSEVQLALTAQVMLNNVGIKAAVVSMPCQELFDQQPTDYRQQVLGKGVFRVAIEALSTYGWEKYVGDEGAVIGMRQFGASGPADQLYQFFGITAEAVADVVTARLKR